jgi:hypothetical protein
VHKYRASRTSSRLLFSSLLTNSFNSQQQQQ